MKIIEIEACCREIQSAISRIIVGKDDVLRQLLAGILANGHILIEDYPGLAKTLIARLLSEAFDLAFKRIQFTPDLLPGDITGSFLYDQREARYEFRRGPIFTQLLLADEINRATPKTQSALLEAVHVDRSIEEYIVDIARATREDPRVALGASPRGSLALLRLARAEAALRRSDFVIPDDVKALAVPALAHRLVLRPELWVSRVAPADIIMDILGRVPTPKAITQ